MTKGQPATAPQDLRLNYPKHETPKKREMDFVELLSKPGSYSASTCRMSDAS